MQTGLEWIPTDWFTLIFQWDWPMKKLSNRDINDAVSVWNTHRIRPTRNVGQSGKPCIVLFTRIRRYQRLFNAGRSGYSWDLQKQKLVQPDPSRWHRHAPFVQASKGGDRAKLPRECRRSLRFIWNSTSSCKLGNIICRKHNNLEPVTFEWTLFSVIKLMRLIYNVNTKWYCEKKCSELYMAKKNPYFGVVFFGKKNK